MSWARTLLAAVLLFGTAAYADVKARAPSSSGAGGDAYAAFIDKNTTKGPAKVAIRNQAVLDLPEGFAFLPEKPARALMKRLGNGTDEDFVGLVMPAQNDHWFVIVEAIASGYVKDDDAREWNADDLLKDIRKNTEIQNLQRKKANLPEMEITGWVEPPHYDAGTHRLVWSIGVRTLGAGGEADVNYRTLMLGREGYVALDMVTMQERVEIDKPTARLLLSRLTFNAGKRYGDFNASTDRVAEFGLAALIGGLAVKKLGLFALIAAFFAKGAKVFAVIGVAVLAWFRRMFGRRKSKEAAAAAPEAPAAPAPEAAPAPAADPPEAPGPG